MLPKFLASELAVFGIVFGGTTRENNNPAADDGHENYFIPIW